MRGISAASFCEASEVICKIVISITAMFAILTVIVCTVELYAYHSASGVPFFKVSCNSCHNCFSKHYNHLMHNFRRIYECGVECQCNVSAQRRVEHLGLH